MFRAKAELFSAVADIALEMPYVSNGIGADFPSLTLDFE